MGTTVSELKKLLGLNIPIGQVRKNSINDYWSTNTYMETPFFGKVMRRNRFTQILQSIHLSNNEEMPENAIQNFKVDLMLNYILDKFGKVYKPKQNLSLNDAKIPYRRTLKVPC